MAILARRIRRRNLANLNGFFAIAASKNIFSHSIYAVLFLIKNFSKLKFYLFKLTIVNIKLT